MLPILNVIQKIVLHRKKSLPLHHRPEQRPRHARTVTLSQHQCSSMDLKAHRQQLHNQLHKSEKFEPINANAKGSTDNVAKILSPNPALPTERLKFNNMSEWAYQF